MIIANDNTNKLHLLDKKNKYEYYEIDESSQNDSHASICRLVKKGSTVLDIGCASGIIGDYLSKNKNCIVDGIDLDIKAIELAKKLNSFNNLYNLNLDIEEEYKMFEKKALKYDYLIFADVLEHIYDPIKVIYQYSEFLKYNGEILISIPNVSNYDVIFGLINGNFNYSEVGILDNTHIRFFTKDSFFEYIKNTNNNKKYKFDCEYIENTKVLTEKTEENQSLYNLLKINNEIETFQFIFKLKKIKPEESAKKLKEYSKNKLIEPIKLINKECDMSLENLLTKPEIKEYIKEKDRIIEKINQENTEKDQIIEKINQENTEKNQIIEKINQENTEKDQIIEKINQENTEKDQMIENLNKELSNILNSKSWKVTEPLRKVTNKIKRN